MTASDRSSPLPGSELVEIGIADLAAGRETIEALLVASAAERFAELGRKIPAFDRTDLTVRLYAAVESSVGERQAHSHYNALRRRLLSYLASASVGGLRASPARRR